MTSSTTKANGLPKWIRYCVAAYLRGKGLSMGVPSLIDGPLFPILAHEGTAFELKIGPAPQSHVVGDDLSVFADGQFDHIVAGLNDDKLLELIAKLKVGGHLVTVYPEEYINPPVGQWLLKERLTEDGLYVCVFKLLAGKTNQIIEPSKAEGRKRVCIARYGAIGDALQLTPMIHQLHDDGYDVTLNISPYTVDVYKHNPFVKNIIVQERNVIPNQDLGEYWDYWSQRYDRYINLSESIEGKLLKVEGRTEFYTPKSWRHATCNINYHDRHMEIAGLEHSKYLLPELYFSKSEEKDINYELRPLHERQAFIIAWALKGSSHHKLYAFLPEVANAFLSRYQDAWILLMGGPESVALQIDHDRIIGLAGEWPIRKSMLLTKYADLVIGPESAIINAASCFDTPKIALLSHSTATNLTKYWTNTVALEPDLEAAPCYPCHQLHYSLESCPTVDLEIDSRRMEDMPRCATAINPTVLYNAIETVYKQWKSK